MKNLFTKHLSLVLFSFTIPIQTKISIPKIPTKVSSFFIRNKEEITHQEFNNVSRLEIVCDHGPVTIETWNQPCVLVETKKRGNEIFLKNTQTCCQLQDHKVNISIKKTDPAGSGHLALHVLVPKDLPIKIKTLNDQITIKKVSGPLELETNRGTIDVIEGTNTIIAKTIDGNINIQRKKIESDHALNLYSQHGHITLLIPQNINADLQAHTQHGKIYSDLFVTLHPQTTLLNEDIFKNMHRHVYGLIGQPIQNNNPATILLSTDFGTISLHPYDFTKKRK